MEGESKVNLDGKFKISAGKNAFVIIDGVKYGVTEGEYKVESTNEWYDEYGNKYEPKK